MGRRFTDLFQESQQQEEVFAPSPVVESLEVFAPEPSAPEAVAEEKEVFNPTARDADGDGFIQEGTPYERPAPQRKTRKRG